MKNLKSLLFLFLLITVFHSCKTIKETDFVSDAPIENKLPALVPTLDIYNLEKNISFGYIKITGDKTGYFTLDSTLSLDSFVSIMGPDEGILEMDFPADSLEYYIRNKKAIIRYKMLNPDEDIELKCQLIPDERVNDLIRLYGVEVNNNLCVQESNAWGYCDLEILSLKEKRNPFLAGFSAITLCVPALLGAPIQSLKTTIEIKICIYDSKNRVIETYTAKGKGVSFIALYWGYFSDDGWRKSLLLAFSDAMSQIKQSIERDSFVISEKLQNQF